MTEYTDTDPAPGTGQIDRREPFRKGIVPESHRGPYHVSQESADWLREQGLTADSVVTMERLRRENVGTWSFILRWVTTGSRERVRLLRLMAENRLGVTYADIADRLDVSDRRARDFIKELRDEDVVETPGRPAQVRFVDDDHYLMAVDVAAFV